MESVMTEGFCMWKVCIQNNKILETSIELCFNLLLDFVGNFWEMGLFGKKR